MYMYIFAEYGIFEDMYAILQVFAWAGISTKGATNIFCFNNGTMDSIYYQEILTNHLLPFIDEQFDGEPHRFAATVELRLYALHVHHVTETDTPTVAST